MNTQQEAFGQILFSTECLAREKGDDGPLSADLAVIEKNLKAIKTALQEAEKELAAMRERAEKAEKNYGAAHRMVESLMKSSDTLEAENTTLEERAEKAERARDRLANEYDRATTHGIASRNPCKYCPVQPKCMSSCREEIKAWAEGK